MINLIPHQSRRIELKTMVADESVSLARSSLHYEVLKQGAEQVIQHIVKDCTTSAHDEKKHATVFTVSAVVMTVDEFSESMRDAYLRGVSDARSRCLI